MIILYRKFLFTFIFGNKTLYNSYKIWLSIRVNNKENIYYNISYQNKVKSCKILYEGKLITFSLVLFHFFVTRDVKSVNL